MSLPSPGDVLLDKYEIDEVLGEGGFGRVYAATDTTTKRRVAIKVLKVGKSLGASARVARFLRELRAIAKLQSPHTVTLFDYGRTEDGAPFMVCEHIAGEDLHELLHREGALGEGAVVHILEQLLRSLAEAHDLGILHRDIKPANVRLFEYGDDSLRAKLLDFGLAKSLREDEVRLTRTGNVIGTPRYMSPEQIFGTELTPASDLYSVGLLAYEMVVGPERNREIAAGRPRSLTTADGVSDGVRAVINRLLSPDVAERFARADDVLAALSRSAVHSPAPPTMPEPRAAPEKVAPSSDPPTTQQPSRVRSPVPEPPAVSGKTGRGVLSTLWIVALVSLVLLLGVVVVVITAGDDPPPAKRALPVGLVKADQPPAPQPGIVADRADVEVDAAAAVDTDEPEAASPGCGISPGLRGFGNLQMLDGLTASELAAYVPPDYDPERAYPLIVLLHESGADPAEFIVETRFAELDDDVIVVAPYGGFQSAWAKKSASIIKLAIDDARQTLCVDGSRIFLVGHSSGGGAAEQAPCRIPRIRALATTAYRRTVPGRPVCPTDPMPSINLVGRRDGYNPVDGGRSCSGYEKVSLATHNEFWRVRNGCASADSSTWLKHRAGICQTWECEAPLVSCVLNGGRGWVGTGDRAIDIHNCDRKPAKFPYAETIWRFFESVAPAPEAEVAAP